MKLNRIKIKISKTKYYYEFKYTTKNRGIENNYS